MDQSIRNGSASFETNNTIRKHTFLELPTRKLKKIQIFFAAHDVMDRQLAGLHATNSTWI